jgi:hypothetical protein
MEAKKTKKKNKGKGGESKKKDIEEGKEAEPDKAEDVSPKVEQPISEKEADAIVSKVGSTEEPKEVQPEPVVAKELDIPKEPTENRKYTM